MDVLEKQAYSVAEFCAVMGVGKTTAFAEIKSGRLKVARVGKRTLIPIEAARAWLKKLTEKTATAA